MAFTKRAERSDKKERIYPYLSRDTYSNLEKLCQSVNTQDRSVSIHDICEDILDVCVQSPEIIDWLMRKYRVPMDHPMRAVFYCDAGKSGIKHFYEC